MRSTPRCGAASRTVPPASSVLFFARTKTDSPVESQNETSARSKTRRVRPFSSRSLIWSCSCGAVAMSSSPATDTTTMSPRCSVCTVRDIRGPPAVIAERYSKYRWDARGGMRALTSPVSWSTATNGHADGKVRPLRTDRVVGEAAVALSPDESGRLADLLKEHADELVAHWAEL